MKLSIIPLLLTDTKGLSGTILELKKNKLEEHIGWEVARKIALTNEPDSRFVRVNLGSLSSFKGISHSYLNIQPSLLLPDGILDPYLKENDKMKKLVGEISDLEDECIVAMLVQGILTRGELNRENLYWILKIFGEIPEELVREVQNRNGELYTKELLTCQANKYIPEPDKTQDPFLSHTRNTSNIIVSYDGSVSLKFRSSRFFSNDKRERVTFVKEEDEEKMRYSIGGLL